MGPNRIPSYQEYVSFVQQMGGNPGYISPYTPAQTTQNTPASNVLPPQQVLQANGKASIDALRMSPNSSVYIEDATNPNLIWKCVSDGLGQVTSRALDVSPHEDAPILDTSSLFAIVGQMNDRLTKLEEEAHGKHVENIKPGANRGGKTKGDGTENAE